ncbi:aminotransferase class IV [Flavobacterium haoranii]|uniref:branched-chain-amino-acid transaminase n=1 Tax=Flavobacterium haoranii TaxID=683124 RepID=A0A1M6BET9_9FLAO|nr:aminotransferase class IV [Flavobacterium haoranii]MDK2771969.1 aminotransferase class IV [Flavobacterium sp.]SHI46963.1 branched-chain amino acid aminotransferase [Flavobacterium haoranii]
MVNFNGNIQENSTILIENNRGFLFGDAIFETIKVAQNKILFSEDHYFRLMSAMRICRMEIPMNFTLEYFEEQILKLTNTNKTNSNFRVRFSVYRKGDGFYLPKSKDIDFIITYLSLDSHLYELNSGKYEIELYKDAHITKQIFSTLKSNNKMIQITGSIFADENGYDNCLLLNDEKNVIEALQSNIFIRFGSEIQTPSLSDGCLNGIMRKQIISLIKKNSSFEITEKSISPFDLQKADEIFLTNTIKGIQSVTQYRKKSYTNEAATALTEVLNNSLFN